MYSHAMDERARKISETMRAKKLDNTKQWREKMRSEGRLPTYEPLVHDGDLAELIGVVLGDGHIHAHPRCESLRIVGNSNSPGFANRYCTIVTIVFGKEPHIAKRRSSNAINITLYQKFISVRLGIPAGNRNNIEYILPEWIKEDSNHVIRFLRGLYEAEGCLAHHTATYTHKLQFANKNESLLKIVFDEVSRLGFHPHRSGFQVQISKRAEVQKLADLLQFRHY